jgi:hypothetical protein
MQRNGYIFSHFDAPSNVGGQLSKKTLKLFRPDLERTSKTHNSVEKLINL